MFKASYTHPEDGTIDARRHAVAPKRRRTATKALVLHEAYIATENHLGETIILAGPDHVIRDAEHPVVTIPNWLEFVRAFDNNIMGNNALSLVNLLHEKAPRAQFVSPVVEAKLLDRSFHYRSTLASLFFDRDLTDVTVLVLFLVPKAERYLGMKVEGPQYPTARHLTGKWFGFSDIDEAVLAKMSSVYPSELIEIV